MTPREALSLLAERLPRTTTTQLDIDAVVTLAWALDYLDLLVPKASIDAHSAAEREKFLSDLRARSWKGGW